MRKRTLLVWIVLLAAGSPSSAAPAADDGACSECHDEVTAAFSDTAHGILDCDDCHVGVEDVPHAESAGEVACADCHDEIVSELAQSVHRFHEEAASFRCATCHGDLHATIPAGERDSPVHPSRLAETCGGCHASSEMADRFRFHLVRPLEAYLSSVHAGRIRGGEESATCSDCHGSHGILPAADPRSLVHHANVPRTCGACHAEIAAAYTHSVHGQAAEHGVREAPVCTDCHGEHRILSPRDRSAPVFTTNIPKIVCGRCHGDLRLTAKFGMPRDSLPTYEDSYHGLASRSGSLNVAHCGSCHGVHEVLPSSDPKSHVHPANLPATCGHCHPEAATVFSLGPVHVLPEEPPHPAVYYTRLVYLWLIYLTIGGMLLHNLLDFVRKAAAGPRAAPSAGAGTGEERMSPGFRVAHALLMISFAVLVYTGFALKYPESRWARPLLEWEESLSLRGWLHRVAAVAMLLALVLHLGHLAIDRRARACIARMRPGREDLRELRERMRFFVGRRAGPPEAPPVGYPEKLEYLALMWGLAVMSITGFLLWYDPVLRRLPKWVTDLTSTIHFYEAVLASLAILVWHLYFVIVDPVVYPMDTAWLTGRSSPGRAHERRHAGEEETTPFKARPPDFG